MNRGLLIGAALAAVSSTAGVAHAAPRPVPERVQVVVTLAAPPLAEATARSRVLTRAARTRRLDLASPTSTAYLAELERAQSAVASRIRAAIPTAALRWRYRVVLNGLAVVVPRGRLTRLESIPGVARVWPNVTYHSLLDRSPGVIGAPQLWGTGLSTAGQGMKIGVIDDGIDQSHPFFSGSGFAMPPGYPKGNAAYTTTKVIVARAFPPPSPSWKHAAKPFDPEFSAHATHVAGIAAGNNGIAVTGAGRGNATLSGVAPRAYLGNYKVLTIPTVSGVGLDGNAAEIAAAVEAAVRDGMHVINLSLGEPEIEPSRDLVVRAINAAADAGVVPAIAAGNDYEMYGRGSIGSPAAAAKAITVAAASKTKQVATFSSSGPTPISLQLKPDVTAPGVSILSSVPSQHGLYTEFSGTSMAAPHVAGGAALLLQRHPTWTVAQVKSALEQTANPVFVEGEPGEAPATREGGGLVDLAKANAPLVFVSPTGLSFGFLKGGTSLTRTLQLTDAGGGAGAWTAAIQQQKADWRVRLSVPPQATVPGPLEVTARLVPGTYERESTGFVVLSRGTTIRRVPYWVRAVASTLTPRPHRSLQRTGTYSGTTRGNPARVSTYRYPELTGAFGLTNTLRGPEQVFRVALARPVANFGVAILSRARGVTVEPRVTRAGEEDRLTGYPALPINLNPYLVTFQRLAPIAGAIRPARGKYDVVFDSRTPQGAGGFRFRFWINDRTPPRARLLSTTLAAGESLRVAVSDAGAGIDPDSVLALVDGRVRPATYAPATGVVTVRVGSLAAGGHSLAFQVSDHQEAKNMEDVPAILPNTREIRATLVVREQ